MKRSLSILVALLFLFPSFSHADEVNAGFVQGLWYSSKTVFADTPTRIYVAFRNNTQTDLTGTIRFTDNGKRIGTSEVSAIGGHLVETWVDWVPTYGDHTLTAVLSNAEAHIIGGTTQEVTVPEATVEEHLTIDYDTDKDGVGNATDTDDDNDGISDIDEKSRGTDPLVPNPKPGTTPGTATKEAPSDETKIPTPSHSGTSPQSSPTTQGLEAYVPDGTADDLLTKVTKKVTDTKTSLDNYRDERNKSLGSQNTKTISESIGSTSVIALGTYTKANATITRSKIETKSEGLLPSFVSSVQTLFQKIFTFVLWGLSHGLGHPAFVQVLLLIGILYVIYRIARGFGRRRNN